MVDYLNLIGFFSRVSMSLVIAGSIHSKDRMIRRLAPRAKYNNRMVLILSTKRKLEEVEMLLDILRLTNAS